MNLNKESYTKLNVDALKTMIMVLSKRDDVIIDTKGIDVSEASKDKIVEVLIEWMKHEKEEADNKNENIIAKENKEDNREEVVELKKDEVILRLQKEIERLKNENTKEYIKETGDVGQEKIYEWFDLEEKKAEVKFDGYFDETLFAERKFIKESCQGEYRALVRAGIEMFKAFASLKETGSGSDAEAIIMKMLRRGLKTITNRMKTVIVADKAGWRATGFINESTADDYFKKSIKDTLKEYNFANKKEKKKDVGKKPWKKGGGYKGNGNGGSNAPDPKKDTKK